MIPIVPIAAVMALSMLRPKSTNPETPKISMAASLLWVFGSIWLTVHTNRAMECVDGLPGGDCSFMTAPASFLIDLVTVLLLFPWVIATLITIPMGLVRCSWVLGWLASVRFSGDRLGGAALAAAWSLLRCRRPDAAAMAFVEAHIATSRPLRAAGIVAAALARTSAGQRDAARALMESAVLLDAPAAPRQARKLAREWLVVDAVADGNWQRAAELGQPLAPQPSTWTTRFLAAVAVRLAPFAVERSPGPSQTRLVLSWLLSRRRGRGLVLLRRALATSPPAGAVVAAPAAVDDVPGLCPPGAASALRRAVWSHVQLLAGMAHVTEPQVLARQAATVGRAWELAVSDQATRRYLAERSLALGVGGAELALHAAATTVQEDLAAWALETGRGLPQGAGPLVDGAAARLRDRLLADVEMRAEVLRERVEARRALPVLDEWREWLGLRDSLARVEASCGWAAQKSAFTQLHAPICALASWMWNDRGERALGNAIFRWLHEEALAAGDQLAIELERRNVQAGAL